MRRALVLLLLVALLSVEIAVAAAVERLSSPDGTVVVLIETEGHLQYSVSFRDSEIVTGSPLSMTLQGGQQLGASPRLLRSAREEVRHTLHPVVPVKNAVIEDHFNSLTLEMEGGYSVVFRAYDDAVAYRWVTDLPGTIRVQAEQVHLQLPQDASVYFPEEESYLTHSERSYQVMQLSKIRPEQFCSLPMLIKIPGGPKVVVTEADLSDYPGLYLYGTGGLALTGRNPAVAVQEEQRRDRTIAVTGRADYIAETRGARSFPWRMLAIADHDRDLLENEIVYKLAPSQQLNDTSWIRPGKVAWDWWNANNLFGVEFRAGINTATYRHYIDFAARHGIEYVILDEGWYQLGDLLAVSPEIDIEELFAYADERGVGLILWVVWKTLDDQLHEALDQFQEWGAAGIKVDFMQRDDQQIVVYYEKIAREAARRHLLVDFHGSYSPKGLRRAWPNVMTREGVKGLEHCKWSAAITPEHDVTIPFIRMLAGPMDFTPGAMDNAQGSNFSPRFTRPMSQGTRCHQLAMYVVYESPLQMLADSPSRYDREPECMRLLSQVPTVWDQTIALDAQVGDYLLIARRSGDEWYVAAMSDENARELSLELSFLSAGRWSAEIYQDGINADRYGNDFATRTVTVTSGDRLEIKLAPGGGWVARLSPKGS